MIKKLYMKVKLLRIKRKDLVNYIKKIQIKNKYLFMRDSLKMINFMEEVNSLIFI